MTNELIEAMRSAFEHWYSEGGQHRGAVERSGDGYHLGRAQLAWMAWKEAWITAAPDHSEQVRQMVEGVGRD